MFFSFKSIGQLGHHLNCRICTCDRGSKTRNNQPPSTTIGYTTFPHILLKFSIWVRYIYNSSFSCLEIEDLDLPKLLLSQPQSHTDPTASSRVSTWDFGSSYGMWSPATCENVDGSLDGWGWLGMMMECWCPGSILNFSLETGDPDWLMVFITTADKNTLKRMTLLRRLVFLKVWAFPLPATVVCSMQSLWNKVASATSKSAHISCGVLYSCRVPWVFLAFSGSGCMI